MNLYKHDNYKQYKKAQIVKNKKKINLVWVKRPEIQLISKKIKKLIPNASFGICHGVRNAWEVKQLRNLLGINVLGTDIAPSATQFENTIQWDFHNVKDEWKDNVDFIYSNSFDHSYDPESCLDAWMKCIKKGSGICFIHWMSTNTAKIDAADCFAAPAKEFKELFNKKYRVIDQFGKRGRIVFMIKHKKKGLK
jgi:hypothetical protein